MEKLGLGRRRIAAVRGPASVAIVALLILASAALPSVSAASSVAVDKEKDGLVVTAAPGERNAFSVTVSAGVYTVADTGSSMGTGMGCTRLAPGQARCTAVPGGPIGFLLLARATGTTPSRPPRRCPPMWMPARAPTP